MSENGGNIEDMMGYSTRTIHKAQSPDQWSSKAVVPPIILSGIFKLYDAPEFPDHNAKIYNYSRLNNPNRDILEKTIATLDNAKHCVSYASGSAATANLTHILKPGDHVLGADDLYGGTTSYLTNVAVEHGLEISFFNPLDLSALEKAIQPNTKMVWIESPSNPLLNITDIRKVSEICHARSQGIIVVVDNTYLTSYFQKPLDLGADVALYSVTKYLNGHSDAVMGAIAFNDDKINVRLRYLQNCLGCNPSPFDCYLVSRAMKTLSIRMREHMTNSLEIAKFLQTHPQVEKVIHPGLPSHPQHELFMSQSSGWSGMIAFYMKSKNIKDTIKFMQSLKICTFASSFGDTESLVSAPAVMSHVMLSEEERKKMGITDSLIRFSVGIEDVEDLKQDLKQAFRVTFGDEK